MKDYTIYEDNRVIIKILDYQDGDCSLEIIDLHHDPYHDYSIEELETEFITRTQLRDIFNKGIDIIDKIESNYFSR